MVVAGGETLELSVESFTLHGLGESSSLSTKPIDHDLVFNLGTDATLETHMHKPVIGFEKLSLPLLRVGAK